jgi:hypothetical protein
MPYAPVATDKTQPLDTVEAKTAAAEFRTLKAYQQTTPMPFNIPCINVKGDPYFAVGNGISNDTVAIDNGTTAAIAAKIPVLIPAGSYLYSGTVYPVDSHAIIFNRSYPTTINEALAARSAPLTIYGATATDAIQDSTKTRHGFVITFQPQGGQHGNCARFNLQNYGTDVANTGLYSHAVSAPGAASTMGVHSETRAAGGNNMCYNAEAASYADTGRFYGALISNTTGSINVAGVLHPITGLPAVAHSAATGLCINGSNDDDPMGGWVYGMLFEINGMRDGGICIQFDVQAAVDALIKSATSVECAVADIFLQGDSLHGIILNGTYGNAALRINDDQYISLRGNNALQLRYTVADDEVIIKKGASTKFAFYTATDPELRLNGSKVVTKRKTGWGSVSGTVSRANFNTATAGLTEVVRAMGALLTDLGTGWHGLTDGT